MSRDLRFLKQFESNVREITQDFLRRHKLSFFGFDLVSRNGNCLRLASDYRVIEHLHSHRCEITPPIPKEVLSEKMVYLVPEFGNSLDSRFDTFKQRFNIGHVIDYIECRGTSYEQFWLFSPLEHNRAVNFYLNRQAEISEFFLTFKKHFEKVLSNVTKNSIDIPFEMIQSSSGIWTGARPEGSRSQLGLTKREEEYLPFILMGLTAMEIAQHLELSKRTVQHYLENIKHKLDSHSKADLIYRILELKLVDEAQLRFHLNRIQQKKRL